MKANLTDFGLQRRSLLFLALPSRLAAGGLPCEGVRSPVQHLHEGPTSNHHAGVFEPTCSRANAQHPNQMKPEAALSHWSLRYALHHAETRLCISLQFHISFIANIARKRPELKWDKTSLVITSGVLLLQS
jgi:hypothetical protein